MFVCDRVPNFTPRRMGARADACQRFAVAGIDDPGRLCSENIPLDFSNDFFRFLILGRVFLDSRFRGVILIRLIRVLSLLKGPNFLEKALQHRPCLTIVDASANARHPSRIAIGFKLGNPLE